MSNNLPSNIYAGGAVSFNSTPYTQYYLQQKARNEAKKEAIDNYYAEMSKTLTPTGMEGNDVDYFIAGKNQWQQFNIQNKNILNDPKHPDYAKTLAQSNYLYNNVASLVSKSQAKVKGLTEIYNLTKTNKRGVTDASLQYIDEYGKPVLQGGGGQLNLTKIVANPDLFDAQKQKSFLDVVFEGIKPEKTPGKTFINAKTKEARTPYTEAYNPKSLEIASKRALSLYENTPEAQAYFENELDKHGQDFENNNAAFKAVYGRDITNGKDLAIGWVLNNGSVVNSGIDVHNYTPPSTTNIRVNDSTAATDTRIAGMVNAIRTGDINAVNNALSYWKRGAQGVKFDKAVDNGDGTITLKTKSKYTPAGSTLTYWMDGEDIVLSKSDPYLVDNVISNDQTFMGSDNKAEKANVPESGTKTNPVIPNKSKKINLGNNN